MKKLASRIAREFKEAKYCAVFEPELNRVWPHGGERREAAISSFAEQHGWRLRCYMNGFCAILERPAKYRPHKIAPMHLLSLIRDVLRASILEPR